MDSKTQQYKYEYMQTYNHDALCSVSNLAQRLEPISYSLGLTAILFMTSHINKSPDTTAVLFV